MVLLDFLCWSCLTIRAPIEATVAVGIPSQSKSEVTAFTLVVKGLVTDLVAVTPKINGFFSASTRLLSTVGETETVYAVAQCWELYARWIAKVS